MPVRTTYILKKTMRRFQIKDLEKLTGIKPHTIRTWEKRYQVLSPQRTKSNVRYYQLSDLILLLDIGLLLQYGYRISRLAGHDERQLQSKIETLTFDEVRFENAVNRLVKDMFMNRVEAFEESLNHAIEQWGIDTTIRHLILPFLEKTDLLSYRDKTASTHFAVTTLRRKIIWGIEQAAAPISEGPSALLFLPKGEHYDLLLLYTAYVLKTKGRKVWYLGTDISLENLELIASEKQPEEFYTHMISRHNFPLAEYVHLVKTYLPRSKLHVLHTDKLVLEINTRVRQLGTPYEGQMSYRQSSVHLTEINTDTT